RTSQERSRPARFFLLFFSKTAFTAHTRPFRLTFFPIWSDRRIFLKFFLVIINALVRIPTFFRSASRTFGGRSAYVYAGRLEFLGGSFFAVRALASARALFQFFSVSLGLAPRIDDQRGFSIYEP